MATLAQFSQNIRKRGSQVQNAGARVVRATAKKALKTLVYMTPVDTGLTRSNWRVSITARTYATIEPYARLPKKRQASRDRDNERANANGAISAGFAVIDRLRPGRGNALSNALYITNNVEYLPYIHKGKFLRDVEQVIQGFQSVISNVRVFTDSEDDEEE